MKKTKDLMEEVKEKSVFVLMWAMLWRMIVVWAAFWFMVGFLEGLLNL